MMEENRGYVILRSNLFKEERLLASEIKENKIKIHERNIADIKEVMDIYLKNKYKKKK